MDAPRSSSSPRAKLILSYSQRQPWLNERRKRRFLRIAAAVLIGAALAWGAFSLRVRSTINGVIHIKVVDASGRPVSGACVDGTPEIGGAFGAPFENGIRTDERGCADLPWIFHAETTESVLFQRIGNEGLVGGSIEIAAAQRADNDKEGVDFGNMRVTAYGYGNLVLWRYTRILCWRRPAEFSITITLSPVSKTAPKN